MTVLPAIRPAFALIALALLAAVSAPARAQDPFASIDMTSDAFTKAEMTRKDIETALAALPADGTKLDLVGKALNGLDLTGMDLRRTELRAARLNKAILKNANLEGVSLDQAWAVEADFTGAHLAKATLSGAQMMRSKFDDADLSNAVATANFAYASLLRARFDGANLSPGKRNFRSMVKLGFQSAKLDEASFKGANMVACFLEYASLRGANLSDAVLAGSDLAGADLKDADVRGADFMSADFNSAHIGGLRNLEAAKNFDHAVNVAGAYRD